MEPNEAVKTCTECLVCKFTRNSKRKSIFYSLARKIQGLCPCCRSANEALKKDFQKSGFFE
ncbi:MAG: hypothetical protein U9R44_03970 [Candidatus Omnitrophota bacterium]|nr:hypothetical protein [Candidatus Omnitrophota bacterium]